MRSSINELRNRGKITIEDLHDYNDYSTNELVEMLTSKEAYKRTVVVKLLAEKNNVDDDLIDLFLQMLVKEKKLYTKIELCDALSKGGIQSAKKMVNYLGRIGKNQHDSLPVDDFKKKSYPLPRDIIARTLAHMEVDIVPVLLDVLKTNNPLAIREVIDAIGFLSFYKEAGNQEVMNALLVCLNDYYNDDIVRWKLVRAFGSFNDNQFIKILVHIKQNDNEQMIRNEANRSLMIMHNRRKYH